LITAPNTTIKTNAVTGIVKFGDKSSSFTSPVDWEQLDNDWIDFTVNESRKITADASTDFFELGEFIQVRTSGGFSFLNQIELITEDAAPVIILKKDILDYEDEEITSGTVYIKTYNPKLSIKAMDEGYYVLQPSNQKLIIRNNWLQPALNMGKVESYYKDATNLSLAEIANYKETALAEIYNDLSGFDNYFDIIDEVNMEQLLILSFICVVYKSAGGEISENNNFCKMYDSAMQVYKPKAKYHADDTTGEIISNIPDMNISVGEYSL